MDLHLIRHGQSIVNLPEYAGITIDGELTALGRQQAQRLAAWLPPILPKVDVIYASSMRRARETAEPLAAAYGMPIRFDDRVREIGMNQINHEPWPTDEIPANFAPYWASERPFQAVVLDSASAETMMHFRTRVGIFLEEIVTKHRNETVIVVCHGGVFDIAFDHFFNVGAFRRCEVWTKNTAITHFRLVEHPNREVWRLYSHNRVEHLPVEMQS